MKYRSYDKLLDLLDEVGSHLKFIKLAEWLLVLACVALAVPVFAVLAELAFHPTVPSVAMAFHLLMWGIFAAGMLVCLAFVVKTMARRMEFEQVAIHVEGRFPNLSNSLINSVQLANDPMVVSEPLVEKIISDTVNQAGGYDLRASVDKRLATRLAGASVFCVAAFAVLLFAAGSNDRVSNAFQRLMRPFSYTPVVGSVRIVKVTPGDKQVFFGEDLVVTADVQTDRTDVEGQILYKFEDQADPITKTMSPVGAAQFVYHVKDVRAPLEYRLKIGDSETRAYKVTIARRPEIERLDLVYEFPPYTRMKDLVEKNSRGNIRAVKGSRVTVKVACTKDIKKGSLLLASAKKQVALKQTDPTPQPPPPAWGGGAGVREMEARLTITDDDSYTIHLEDADGYTNKDPISLSITALPDRNPIIRFTYPDREITAAPGDVVKLALRAADDFGLSEVVIFCQDTPDAPIRRLQEWKDIPGKEFMPVFQWKLVGADGVRQYEPGNKVTYYAEAVDNNAVASAPGRSQTTKYTINIENTAEKLAEKEKALSDWEHRLSEILKAQKAARSLAAAASQQDIDNRHRTADELKLRQADIRTQTMDVAGKISTEETVTIRIKDVLLRLSGNEMADAVRNADGLLKSKNVDEADSTLAKLTATQDAIIAALEKILGIIPEVANSIKKQPDLLDGYDVPSDVQEKLKDLADKLKDFASEQKKVIAVTSDLAKKSVDDFTEQDLLKLEELAAIEDKWSSFLKDTYSDFSKLPEQDFSNPSMLQEMIQTQSEVQMAKDALKAKAAELATALEDNGLELAEAMTTHIEKWLPDAPDRIEWKMEEVLGDYESPMAELPKELEDLVGDLFEQEEDLMEDMEDATSTYADSIDKGAGWDAMDGPISNMSAQGVTGNQLPNTSEIGGRSGEGRSGKSAGEFVGDSAVGKGGRKTPTRLTPDPFEKGQIKDTSPEPPGGSTGGGKLSGAAQEGMEGPIPPELELKMKSLAKRQAAILNNAEKISAAFQVARWPSLFQETVDNLKSIEDDLTAGRYRDVLHKRDVVLKGIEDTRRFIGDQLKVNRDWSSKLPTKVQDEILDSMGGKAPRGYEDLLKSYYESLSRTE